MSQVKILSKVKSDSAFSLQVWGGKPKVVVVRGCGGRDEGRISSVSGADFERLKGIGLFATLLKSGRFSVVEDAPAKDAPAPNKTEEGKPEERNGGDAPPPDAPADAGNGETGDLFDGDGDGDGKGAEDAPAAPKRKRYTGLKTYKRDAAADSAAEKAK